MKIGFIGLGVMGKPMAINLIKKGFSLIVNDVDTAKVEELVSLGAGAASSNKELAEKCDVICAILPNGKISEIVACGDEGVMHGAKEGSIFVDLTSASPLESKRIHAKLAEKGIRMIDAPVSGGEPKAIDGTLAIMAGGDAADIKEVEAVLLAMGSSVKRIGDVGAGNYCKLANQIMVAVNLASVSEALVFASKAGVDPKAVYEAVRGGLAGSTVLDAKAPLILERNFKPGATMEIHIKDLTNVLDVAHDIGMPVPITAQIYEMMQTLKTLGHGKDDHGGLVQYFELLANVKVEPVSGEDK